MVVPSADVTFCIGITLPKVALVDRVLRLSPRTMGLSDAMPTRGTPDGANRPKGRAPGVARRADTEGDRQGAVRAARGRQGVAGGVPVLPHRHQRRRRRLRRLAQGRPGGLHARPGRHHDRHPRPSRRPPGRRLPQRAGQPARRPHLSRPRAQRDAAHQRQGPPNRLLAIDGPSYGWGARAVSPSNSLGGRRGPLRPLLLVRGRHLFSGGQVSFDGALFSDGCQVWFSNATFSGSEVWFSNTVFSGSKVWFTGVARFDPGQGGVVGTG